jgi:hypothetical protein
MPLALTAFAGMAAVAAARGVLLDCGNAYSKKQDGEPELERSITIGKIADELRHC